VPIRYAPAPARSETAEFLRGREGAVAYLPLGERDTEVMLAGAVHFRPMLNGDSGFMPRPYSRAMELLQRPLGAEALRYLRAVDVRDVVSRGEEPLPLVARFGAESVYGVPAGERARAPAPAAVAGPTAWGRDGVVVDSGFRRTIHRVTFEIGDAEWIAAPWVDVSADGVAWERVAAEASLADAVVALGLDPPHGRGEVRFAPRTARWVRLDPRVPARPPLVWLD
jgi:catechol 2,3-dioxygenase-like lactoylglutathione lyase family enzyme